MKPLVVMKFGGTSVGSPEAIARAADHILRQERPLVVTSAVGGVTDLLIQAGDRASRGEDYSTPLDEIGRRQRAILDAHELPATLVEAQSDELMQLLAGIEMLREISPRIRARLVSLGERMSVRILAALLRGRGARAEAFDAWQLGLTTSSDYLRGEPEEGAAAAIAGALERLDDDVLPVVTGFIAHSPEGEITTLGRGGSDFSAALFGAAAGVDEIQIWTDVAGILRADPRIVDSPALVPVMGFDEAAELAYFGAKVLHPRTIEPARQRGIPVRVLSTQDGDPASGTVIREGAPYESIRALAIRRDVESLHIHSLGMLDAPGFLARVFAVFARYQISVDVVATSEVSVSMTFDSANGQLAEAVAEIAEFADVEQLGARSIICLVGHALRGNPLLRGKIFSVLGENEIPVHVISQGASRINLTLVTDPEPAERAVRALYEALF